MFEENASNIII